jgi:soluble P-type ATPase
MISVDIPGFGALELAHLVLDYNGTLAIDGRLLPGVADALLDLAPSLRIHVVTADTFGLAKAELAGLPVELLEAGVWRAPDGSCVAWFRDPDGNTLSLTQRSRR